MSACVNCDKPIGGFPSINCDGCNNFLHVSCTGLTSEDRITRKKIRNVKIYCSKCTSKAEQTLSIHELLQTFTRKRDIIASIEQKIEQKISELQNVNLSSLQFEEVTSEAVERMIRAKNVIIYGVPESSGTAEQGQTKDAAEIRKIISAITPEAIPQKIIRIGKPNSSNTRLLKVSLSNDLIAKEVLRNKNKLINSDLPRSISISDDKTPKQLEYLKNLRTELQLRRDNGEDNITIKYVKGISSIIESKK
jgi:hypothetical protein